MLFLKKNKKKRQGKAKHYEKQRKQIRKEGEGKSRTNKISKKQGKHGKAKEIKETRGKKRNATSKER